MTTPLGPLARNLVAAARSGLDPSAEMAARVRARVALAVGGAASTGAAPAPAVAGKLAIGKLAAILAASGALVIGGWFALRHAPVDQAAPAISLPAPSLDVAPAARAHVTSITHDERVAAIVVPATVPRIKPMVAAAAPTVATAVAVPVAVSPPTLAREVALIDAALASIRANDPIAALATLAIYDRETADHGQLAEDAAALEIDARCRAHQPVADQLAVFAARWPSSVRSSRLPKDCDP